MRRVFSCTCLLRFGDAEPVDDTLTLMIGDDGNQRSVFPEAGRHHEPIRAARPHLPVVARPLVADSYCERKKRLHWGDTSNVPLVKPPEAGHSMLRARQKFGKYRIERRLGEGGFATVYQAMDLIEGIRVALKIPHSSVMDDEVLKDFRNEVRLTARLEHPNILPLKNASFINGHFVIVTPLGEKSLADRLHRRMSFEKILDFADQMLQAVAYAHQQRIIHCDIKPENMILFPINRLKLIDFGIAKVALKTVSSSGSGTLGYMAPEQAMGQPSFRSDVFSLGLIIYRMLSGRWPEWPYEWPPPGYSRMRGRVHPELLEFLRRALQIKPRKRFRDADQMLHTFRRIKPRALRYALLRRQRT